MNSVAATRERSAIAVLMLVSLCQFVDRSIISITLEPVRREFEVGDAWLGLLAGAAYSIPFACAVLPLGALVDRIDRVRLLVGLVLVWSLATAASSLASGIVMLAMFRAIVGFAEAGAAPASLSLLSTIIPTERRGAAIGAFFLASALGTVVTFGGGGFLVQEAGWRIAFLSAGAAGLIVAALLHFTLADPERPGRILRPTAGEPPLTILRHLLSRREVVHLTTGSGIATGLMVGLWAWAASFFIRQHEMDLQSAGLVVAAGAGICAGGGILAAGRLTDRFAKDSSSLLIPLMTLPAAAAAFLILAASKASTLAVAAFLFASFVAPMFLAPSYAVILSLTGSARRGITLAGLQVATNLLGGTMGPAFIGIVAAATGSLSLAFAALPIVGFWAALHFHLARQQLLRASAARRSGEPSSG